MYPTYIHIDHIDLRGELFAIAATCPWIRELNTGYTETRIAEYIDMSLGDCANICKQTPDCKAFVRDGLEGI